MAQSISQESVALTGLVGATQPMRFVGSTTNGAPVSGTWQLGDFLVDQTATVWVYTSSGWWSTISTHIVTRSANATAKVNEATVFTGGSGVTITAPSNPQDGAMWTVVNRGTAPLTLSFASNSMIPLGSGTGVTSYTVSVNGAYSFINYAGGQWYMLTANGADHLVDYSSVALSAWGAASSNISLGGYKITNLANGSSSTDAVAYGQISGLAPTASPSLTNASITTTATATVPLTINGIASQTADYLDIKNSAGTPLLTVSSTGALVATSYNGLSVSTTTGTLTLANGSTFATSGGYSTTLTATNTTSLTLPTSGTLISTTTTLSGGDLQGTLPSPTVTQIQGKAVSTTQATVLSNSGTTASRTGVAGGTSTSTSATGLGASVSWTVNAYAGYTVISGTSTGIVASNTSNTLTLNANGWIGGTPTSGQAFYLAQTAGAGETTVAITSATYLALPIAPPNGTINTIVNTQSGVVTLWRNGSDVINVGSTPTNTVITVNTYQNISLIYYSGVWYTYSGYFSTTGTGAQVYGTRPNLASPYELVTVNTATTLGTGTPAALNGATALPYLYTTNPNGSFAINLTNAPTTAGYSATYVLMVINGSTAYLPSSITINTYATSASGLPAQATPYTSTYTTTTYYQGATPWTSADASTLDIYTITVICTSTNNYTMLLSLSKY